MGLAVSVGAAQEADGDLRSLPPYKPSWWDGLLGRDKVEEKKPAAPPPRHAAPPGPSEAPARPPAIDAAAVARSRELAAYNRRLAVCDRLSQIAEDANDEATQRQVDQLKDRVWEVYKQRTANLASGGIRYLSDEAVLEQRLGAGTANGGDALRQTGRGARDVGSRAANVREDER
jgi:hypothetical protein